MCDLDLHITMVLTLKHVLVENKHIEIKVRETWCFIYLTLTLTQ